MRRLRDGIGAAGPRLKLWGFIGAAALVLALLWARFPDFFIVTFAAFGFAVACGAAAMAWGLWRFFNERTGGAE